MKKISNIFKNFFYPKIKKRKRKNIKIGKNSSKGLMKTDEALKVFNLEKLDIEKEEIDEKFKTMFDNNSIENGGSLYIQAKLLIARNTILNRLGVDLEEKEKLEKENMEKDKQNENIENEKKEDNKDTKENDDKENDEKTKNKNNDNKGVNS